MGCCNSTNIDFKVEVSENRDFLCPKCSQKGSKVKLDTPRVILKETLQANIQEGIEYNWCKNPECEVSYFSSDTEHYFLTKDLKVRATVKDKSLDVHVCYCFNHTRQSVLDELRDTGESTVIEDIKAKMKDPGCFCETSNPQGACCLANNKAWLEEAKKLI